MCNKVDIVHNRICRYLSKLFLARFGNIWQKKMWLNLSNILLLYKGFIIY